MKRKEKLLALLRGEEEADGNITLKGGDVTERAEIPADLLEWWYRTRGQVNGNEFVGVLGGSDNQASGEHAVIGGGYQNQVSGKYATIPGGKGAVADLYGQMAFGGAGGQIGWLQMSAQARNWYDLCLSGHGYGQLDNLLYPIMREGTVWAFDGVISVYEDTSTWGLLSAAWAVNGLAVREDGEDIRLVDYRVTSIAADTNTIWPDPVVSVSAPGSLVLRGFGNEVFPDGRGYSYYHAVLRVLEQDIVVL